MRAPSFIAALIWPMALLAAGPEAHDPLLDGAPSGRRHDQRPVEKTDPTSPGFMVSFSGGIYMGHVSSFLEGEVSELRSAARPFAGFGLGYRTRSRVEVGLDLAAGLGETWDSDVKSEVDTIDLLLQPRILVHLLERPHFGLYSGVLAEAMLFDLETEGINQAGIGPGAVLGIMGRADRHSLFYLEVTGSAFYDLLAFHYEDPTPEALAEDPTLEREKIEGRWYGVYRVIFGYRLSSF